MAGLQLPAGLLAERLGERSMLALGTAFAALAYMLVGWTGAFAGLVVCLALGGLGASAQHPLSSSLIARAFAGRGRRTALSTYNFSGDVGKALFPAVTAGLVAAWHWRTATQFVGSFGLVVALALLVLVPKLSQPVQAAPAESAKQAPALPPAMARRGFLSLSLIGVIDSGTRMGFLTLLPFLLSAKGASLPAIGTALMLVFAGGATGKFVCGVLAARFGVLQTVILTEAGTTLGILGMLPLPLAPSFFLLPLVGVALNGTSSVLYGTVAELAPADRRARAFAIFYTCTIGSGAVSPSLAGLFSDAVGVTATLAAIGAAVLLVLPLSLLLRPALRRIASGA